MAKNNNLTDFLTDIADAIRAKKSTTALINPQDFATEIGSISGGGGTVTDGHTVTFIDIDGTVLKTEMVADGGSATPPDNPTREYCTFVKWVGNYTNVTHDCTVGPQYKSSDGKTRYKIKVRAGFTFTLTFPNSITKINIDWGDGSTSENVIKGTSHTYTSDFEGWISMTERMGVSDDKCSEYVTDAIFQSGSENVSCNEFHSLRSVVLPEGATELHSEALSCCYSLQTVVFPEGMTSAGYGVLYNCVSLRSVMLPDSLTDIGSNAFNGCSSLQSIVIPDSVTTTESNNTFENCCVLQSVVLSDSVTEIYNYVFRYCYALPSIVIPSGVTYIGADVFRYCYALRIFCFLSTTPLESVPDFEVIPYAIYVPDASVEIYKTATGWSQYADIILPISQYAEY